MQVWKYEVHYYYITYIFVTKGDQENPTHLYRFTKRNTPGWLADVLSLHEMKSIC